jgi:hypothetical protein
MGKMRLIKRRGWVLSCAIALAACSDDDTEGEAMGAAEATAGSHASAGEAAPAAGHAAASGGAGAASSSSTGKPDLAAFEATGLTKYLGKAKPAEMEVNGDETSYLFNEADGPVCLRGGRFGMATRDSGSSDLVIYLQGGGSCTNALCRATETANPQIPKYGVLNAADADNPVAGWNVVYSPYCDGSLHFGDSDIPDQNRKHHGLRNVSASLDVAKEKFPKPRRVLLTGASAGGYGTIWITALVRLIYPDAELYVFNDAGIAISNPESADGFRGVLGEWGADKFIPESCEPCKSGPHLTPWMTWNLQHDPSLKLGMFSAYEDSVISGTFLMLDSQVFKKALLDETAKVVDAAPARAKRFLVSGTQHTVGDLQKTAVGDVSVSKWLQEMLDQDQSWDNVLQ